MAYIGSKPANKPVVASDLDPTVITGQTALATSPASTDEFLISDAGVLKRLDASLIGGGKILQVISVAKTDTFSASANSFTDITGLSAAITPSASSSKVLIFVDLKVGGAGSQTARLLRGSTVIYAGASASNRPLGFANFVDISTYSVEVGSATFLDSPSTTSATTYKIQMISSSATYYINRSNADRDTAQYDPRLASSITLIEIGA